MYTEQTESFAKPIRPAASLLLVRDGQNGIEVLTLKRSKRMRFLPGYLAFPGGTVEASDLSLAKRLVVGCIRGQEQADDAGFALAAIRECAEETGWLCGLRTGHCELLDESEHGRLLDGPADWQHSLEARQQVVAGDALRFIGRWVTPENMLARFDTRFFLTVARDRFDEFRMSYEENEWVRWNPAGWLLEEIEKGKLLAVPPTITMLKGIHRLGSPAKCFAELTVPQPV